MMALKNIISNI